MEERGLGAQEIKGSLEGERLADGGPALDAGSQGLFPLAHRLQPTIGRRAEIVPAGGVRVKVVI